MYKRKKTIHWTLSKFALQKKLLKKIKNTSHTLGGGKDLKNTYLVKNFYPEYMLRKKPLSINKITKLKNGQEI